jgi:hypothetical protein
VVTSKYPPRALLRDDRAVESVCADRLVNCADIALVYVAGVSFQRIDRNYGVFLTDRPRLILFPCFSRQVVRVETSGNPILGPLTSEFAPRSPLSAPKCKEGPRISIFPFGPRVWGSGMAQFRRYGKGEAHVSSHRYRQCHPRCTPIASSRLRDVLFENATAKLNILRQMAWGGEPNTTAIAN